MRERKKHLTQSGDDIKEICVCGTATQLYIANEEAKSEIVTEKTSGTLRALSFEERRKSSLHERKRVK
jgi:hypothetical protein